MTAHAHTTYEPGCYRCELSRDETRAQAVEDRDVLLSIVTRLLRTPYVDDAGEVLPYAHAQTLTDEQAEVLRRLTEETT